MKIMLISAVSLIFISGTTLGHEVILSPIAPSHGVSAVTGHRVVELDGAIRQGGVPCTMKSVTVTRSDGSSETRKSVNCEE